MQNEINNMLNDKLAAKAEVKKQQTIIAAATLDRDSAARAAKFTDSDKHFLAEQVAPKLRFYCSHDALNYNSNATEQDKRFIRLFDINSDRLPYPKDMPEIAEYILAKDQYNEALKRLIRAKASLLTKLITNGNYSAIKVSISKLAKVITK